MRTKMELYSGAERRQKNRKAGRICRRERMRLQCVDIVILLLFIVTGVFCATLQAKGSEPYPVRYDEEKYDEMERAYRDEVADVLAQHRLSHCGINLTKITQSDGTREYRLAIHHSGIGKMTPQQRGMLMEGIQGLEFPDGMSGVCVELSF